MEAFLNRYPFWASITIAGGFFVGTSLAIFFTWWFNAAVSIEQAMFLLVLGYVPAMVITWAFYYYAKISLYPAIRIVSFKPLSIFYKLYIPIISTILMLLNVTNLSMYKLIEAKIISSQTEILRQSLHRSGASVEGLLGKVLINTRNCRDDVNGADFSQIELKNFIKRYGDICDNSHTVFFILTQQGDLVWSGEVPVELTEKDREKLLAVSKSQSFDISIGSKGTKPSHTLVFPFTSADGVQGVIGAATPLSLIQETIKVSVGNHPFMLTNKDGSIIVDSTGTMLGKNINKNDVNNSSETSLARLGEATSSSHVLVTLNGKEYAAVSMDMSSLGGKKFLFQDKQVFFSSLNQILLGLSATFFIILVVSSFIIREISRQIAVPVRDTIRIFKEFSSGNLSVDVDHYIPDQFGDSTRHLKIVLEKISDIIRAISSMTETVHETAGTLDSVSTRLSDNSREQAASVEETSASLEETSASLDAIETNSREQSEATE